MKVPFYGHFKQGHETFFSGRAPTKERAAALVADGWTLFMGWADLPDPTVASVEVKTRMKRTLSPGEMPAVKT